MASPDPSGDPAPLSQHAVTKPGAASTQLLAALTVPRRQSIAGRSLPVRANFRAPACRPSNTMISKIGIPPRGNTREPWFPADLLVH